MEEEQKVKINRGEPNSDDIETAPSERNNNRRREYTPITDAYCDLATVRLLRGLLSGRDGELSAINTYIFQQLLTNGQNNNISTILRRIAIEEMRHMELLGSAIISFGGVPRFSNGQGQFWSARNVNYTINPTTFIAENIRAEERAIRNYERVIQRIRNESLRRLLNEIIEDEKQHIVILRGLQ